MQARKTIGSTIGGHLRGPGHAYVFSTIHASVALCHLHAHTENAQAPEGTFMKCRTPLHYFARCGPPISHPPHAAYREPAHFYLPSETKVAWRILIANPEKRVSSKGFQSALGEERGHAAPTQGCLKRNYCYYILQHRHSSLPPDSNLQPTLSSPSCCCRPPPPALTLRVEVIHLQMYHTSVKRARSIQATLKSN